MQHGIKWSAMSLLIWFIGIQSVFASQAGDVAQVVEKNSELLVTKLSQEKKSYYSDPDRFYRVMQSALGEVVDFRRIAGRVMGKYGRKANAEQKNQFVEAFKRSLFDAYGKALVESGEFTINVLTADINKRNKKRASVELEIASSNGNKYPVVYSMYLKKDKGWLLENVIVNGVNIGLAFRDRFEQQYSVHAGNLDKVIKNWSSRLEEAEAKNAVTVKEAKNDPSVDKANQGAADTPPVQEQVSDE